MGDGMILFMVEVGNVHVITWAHGREGAKRNANTWIGGDPDKYIVTPLTAPGDRVHLDITLAV
jgi:hypothetical protein